MTISIKNPTAKQWNDYADVLQEVNQLYNKGRLDMLESQIRARDHKCGTVHCVAGWYAMAFIDEKFNESQNITFTHGKKLIA